MIAHLLTMNVSGPFIVVAPLATLPNWVREFEKWLPTLPVIRFHGSAKERDAMLAGPLLAKNRKNSDFPVIITSYEVAIRDEKRFVVHQLDKARLLRISDDAKKRNHLLMQLRGEVDILRRISHPRIVELESMFEDLHFVLIVAAPRLTCAKGDMPP